MMKLTTRLDYAKRHLWIFLPYLTLQKVFNLLRNVAELRLGVTRPRSFPPYMKIEPTSACHMSCPGCDHGQRSLKRRLNSTSTLSLDQFKEIVDSVGDSLLGISLSLRGEPYIVEQDFRNMAMWVTILKN